MSIRSLILACAAASILLSAASASAANVTVMVNDITFAPAEVTIQPGDTVTWQWAAGSHTITSGIPACPNVGQLFDVPSDSSHPTFTYTYASAGTYPYFCRPHAPMGMLGVVKVEGLALNGIAARGNLVSFTVSNLPASDNGAKALVLLSATGTGSEIPCGDCVAPLNLTADNITGMGLLTYFRLLTTDTVAGGSASTTKFAFPPAPAGLTLYAAAVVVGVPTGVVSSILPPIAFVTQ